MKKIDASILIVALLMACSSASFGQEGMKTESKEGTVQINISADELTRIMKERISIDQELSFDNSEPIMIKISSMPGEKWVIRYSGFLGAVMAFLLALLAFRIQRAWDEKGARTKREKETFDMYISLLIEMKRALDRCKGMSQMPGKSFGRLYVRSEETIFVEYVKRCGCADIIRKMFAIYSLFDLVNWNIEQGVQIEGIDTCGKPIIRDRYGAAKAFISTYLLASSTYYNDLLSYARGMENKTVGKVDGYLVEYDLDEIESMDGIKNQELH